MNLYYEINRRLLPSLVWRKKAAEKVVYLTFDDGPHPQITAWVMDELAKYDAKATFFVVGENAERYPSVIQQLQENGHQVGNHTYHHVKGWGISAAEYLTEIALCQDVIPQKRLFRPPYGRINFASIKQLSDYEIIMWDVLTKDFMPKLDTIKALRAIKKQTVNGSIIVFHDSLKAEKNLKMLLPDYLKFLHDNGFKMKAL